MGSWVPLEYFGVLSPRFDFGSSKPWVPPRYFGDPGISPGVPPVDVLGSGSHFSVMPLLPANATGLYKFWLVTTMEGVHLVLPPQIFSAQVKSRSILNHASLGPASELKKINLTLNLTLTLKVPLPSIAFHNKILVLIMIFTALSFLRLTHGLFFTWGGNVS